MEYEEMFKTGFLADINLKIDEEVVKCHKFVLASYSSFFVGLFTHNPKVESLVFENLEDNIHLADLKTCVWIFYANDDRQEIQKVVGDRSKTETILSFLACSSYLGSGYLLEVCIEYLQNNVDLISDVLPFVFQYDNEKGDLRDFIVTHLKWNTTKEIVPSIPPELFDDIFCPDIYVENNDERMQILTEANAIKPLPWFNENLMYYNPCFRSNKFEGLFTSCLRLRTGSTRRGEWAFNGVIWSLETEVIGDKIFLLFTRYQGSNFPDLEMARLSWTCIVKQDNNPERRFVCSDMTFNGWRFTVPDMHFKYGDEILVTLHITKIGR